MSKKMSSMERLLAVIQHKEPDRVPFVFTFFDVWRKKNLGCL